MADGSRHIELFGQTFTFASRSPGVRFGEEVAFIVPIYGDLGCPCQGCRAYRAVAAVEKQFGVSLKTGGASSHSSEMQAAADRALSKTDLSLGIYGAFSGATNGNGVMESPSNAAGGIFEVRHIENPFSATVSGNALDAARPAGLANSGCYSRRRDGKAVLAS